MSDKPTVVEALTAVMADVQAVRKNKRNDDQGYMFRGIDAVINAVGPSLRTHGVLVLPMLEDASWRDVRTSRDKPARECTVRVRYRFYGPAGDHLEVVVPGESMDFGDKGAAKAMSVAFRIALLQALAIPTDEPENEPDAHTYERAEHRDPSPRALTLFGEITEAATPDALRAAWDAVNAAGKAREVTAGEVAQLKAHITRRKEEVAHPPAGPDVPMVTEQQHRRMHILWREVGMGGQEFREDRLRRTSEIVGRPIESSAWLTEAEAVEVIRILVAEVDAKAPEKAEEPS